MKDLKARKFAPFPKEKEERIRTLEKAHAEVVEKIKASEAEEAQRRNKEERGFVYFSRGNAGADKSRELSAEDGRRVADALSGFIEGVNVEVLDDAAFEARLREAEGGRMEHAAPPPPVQWTGSSPYGTSERVSGIVAGIEANNALRVTGALSERIRAAVKKLGAERTSKARRELASAILAEAGQKRVVLANGETFELTSKSIDDALLHASKLRGKFLDGAIEVIMNACTFMRDAKQFYRETKNGDTHCNFAGVVTFGNTQYYTAFTCILRPEGLRLKSVNSFKKESGTPPRFQAATPKRASRIRGGIPDIADTLRWLIDNQEKSVEEFNKWISGNKDAKDKQESGSSKELPKRAGISVPAFKGEGVSGVNLRTLTEMNAFFDEVNARPDKAWNKTLVLPKNNVGFIPKLGESPQDFWFNIVRDTETEITQDNYFEATETTFEEIKRFEGDGEWSELFAKGERELIAMEEREPERYTFKRSPKSQSCYLLDRKTGDIYRLSDHWGNVASCVWKLDTIPEQSYVNAGRRAVFTDAVVLAKSNIGDFIPNRWKRVKNMETRDGFVAAIDETERRLRSILDNDGIKKSAAVKKRIEEIIAQNARLRGQTDVDDIPRLGLRERRLLRDFASKVYGWYEPKTKRVVLRAGARMDTALHEILGHATFDWARGNAPELYAKMREYAAGAPEEVKAAIRDAYPDVAEGSAAWEDEVFAHLIAADNEDLIRSRVLGEAGVSWLGKVRAWFGRLWRRFVRALGGSASEDLDVRSIAGMDAKAGMRRLVESALAGKRLGTWSAEARERGNGVSPERERFYSRAAEGTRRARAETASKLNEELEAWKNRYAELLSFGGMALSADARDANYERARLERAKGAESRRRAQHRGTEKQRESCVQERDAERRDVCAGESGHSVFGSSEAREVG